MKNDAIRKDLVDTISKFAQNGLDKKNQAPTEKPTVTVLEKRVPVTMKGVKVKLSH